MEAKLLTLVLTLGVSVADWAIKKMGEPVAGVILCKMGAHDWEVMPNSKYKMICRRCHIVDDVRTKGIDGAKKNENDSNTPK